MYDPVRREKSIQSTHYFFATLLHINTTAVPHLRWRSLVLALCNSSLGLPSTGVWAGSGQTFGSGLAAVRPR